VRADWTQPRFADPRLTDDQSHLAFAFEGPFPTIHQQTQFVLASDNPRDAAAASSRPRTPLGCTTR
jgi:hypothetical protein